MAQVPSIQVRVRVQLLWICTRLQLEYKYKYQVLHLWELHTLRKVEDREQSLEEHLE